MKTHSICTGFWGIALLGFLHVQAISQTAIANIYGRNITSLNGDWQAIVDPADAGDYRQVWRDKKATSKTEFIEYSFDGGPTLRVPGDFNTQLPELSVYEGVVWYKKTFVFTAIQGKRQFIYFGGVNYIASVYLNGQLLGMHEGGFTPFQFEITGVAKEGSNTVIVKVDSHRQKDGLPGLGYDWFNYGGITRDVYIVTTPTTFIEDYFIQLQKKSANAIHGFVKLNGFAGNETVNIQIPELKVNYQTTAKNGYAEVGIKANPIAWSPGNPKLYHVIISAAKDTVAEQIGFRTIEAIGSSVYLNGKPIFLKGVNIHEERAIKSARATTEADAQILLNYAKELGCNMVRLAHYPHNEHMVRLAEKMGIMVWDEIPVYQHIEFANEKVPAKMELMMNEMLRRDHNRCAVVLWSLSNETWNSTPNRDKALLDITRACRSLDSTRLIASVINDQGYTNNEVNVWDTLYNYLDVVAINEYLGWYVPWQGRAAETKWKMPFNKPVIISEFGGEAKFGNSSGPADEANYWMEAYQEQIYKDQVAMFANVPNLSGTFPWLLIDYRSPVRMHPVYQNGYNRKGLLSELGDKKKAWFVLKAYYEDIKNNN
jgi:beta-glucuronidase